MKNLVFAAAALAVFAIAQPVHAFGGRRNVSVQRVVVRQQVVRQQVVVQRQRFVAAPVVVQQFHAVPVQQVVVPAVQQVVVPGCSSFFVH